MKYLLDTPVWLWLASEPERLSPQALAALTDLSNQLYFSAASSWEISIKYRLGKLPLPEPPHLHVSKRLVAESTQFLPIQLLHTTQVAHLPDYHSDPFDRILVAQAQLEFLTIVTLEPQIARYDIPTIC